MRSPRHLFLSAPVALVAAGTMGGAMENGPPTTTTGFIHDPVFLEHRTGPGFPEHPDRLRWLSAHLADLPLHRRLLQLSPDDTIDPL
ncbi:MAG: hypothetical protein ACO3L2_09890, partial [Chthoniobacterales bacterium]